MEMENPVNAPIGMPEPSVNVSQPLSPRTGVHTGASSMHVVLNIKGEKNGIFYCNSVQFGDTKLSVCDNVLLGSRELILAAIMANRSEELQPQDIVLALLLPVDAPIAGDICTVTLQDALEESVCTRGHYKNVNCSAEQCYG